MGLWDGKIYKYNYIKYIMERIIVKVRETKNNQKIVTIPKDSNIKKGDYVEIKKVK